MVVDGAGNIYFADKGNNRVRKVSPSGIIATVYYNSASHPSGLAIDRVGSLYIAELSNGVVRKVSTNGAITVVAGREGVLSSSGDGGSNSCGESGVRRAGDFRGG